VITIPATVLVLSVIFQQHLFLLCYNNSDNLKVAVEKAFCYPTV